MVRDIIDIYLEIAIGFESQGKVSSADYALNRAIAIEEHRKVDNRI